MNIEKIFEGIDELRKQGAPNEICKKKMGCQFLPYYHIRGDISKHVDVIKYKDEICKKFSQLGILNKIGIQN